jgi:hypothetical protein
MKIALCLSGQPRYLGHIVPMIQKNLLEKNAPDVFFHTWFDKSDTTTKFGSSIPYQDGKMGTPHLDTDIIMKSAFNPVDYIIEPQRVFEVTNRLIGAPTAVPEHLVSMFYSMEQANKLKQSYELKNNFKYDIVIRARFDLFYAEPIDFTSFISIAESGKIASPYKWQYTRMGDVPGLGNYTMNGDIVAGNSETIDIFSTVYSNIEFINKNINPPFAENYFGYRTRVMGGIEVVPHPLNVEILYRVISGTSDMYYPKS